VIATTINTSTLNVASIFGTAGFVGVGTTSASGTTLYVQGNVYASNALTTTNISSTLLNVSAVANILSLTVSSNVGIGTPPNGNALSVQGNVFVSNAISTTNIFATGSLNTATLNTTSMYVTNALTTNVTATLINAATVNATTFSTTVFNGPTSAFVLASNLLVSNAIQTTNLVSGTIYYGEDLFKRGPHLIPTPSNAATIQGWISATCNAASKSWWGTSPQPVFGNVTSISGYNGSLYLPDGRVAMIPTYTDSIGMYNPATTLFSSITIPVTVSSRRYKGGVLAPNGNIVLCPNNTANIGIFNTLSYAWSNVVNPASNPSGDWTGGVLSPSGNVVFSPMGGNIVELNTTTLAVSNILSVGSTTLIWQGVVLLPSGNIVMVPQTSPNILVYNNQTNPRTISNVQYSGSPSFIGGVLTPNGNVAMIPVASANVCIFNPIPPFSFSNIGTGGVRFQGGVLLPSGNIICVPNSTSSNLGMIDPFALTYSNSTYVGSSFNGATLLPNGQVILAPENGSNTGILNTMIPAPREFCLSPYFNKY
jgi:hypothetical protein